jgi:SAM-dependent methyltransferase
VAVTCAWCGAPLDAAVRAPGGLRCPRCTVVTTHPWPAPAELDAAYAGAYRPEGGRFSGPLDALLRATRGALARRIDARAPAGPVLDVGAGDGTLVRALRRRGRAAHGVERGDGPLPAGPFAAVVLWHVLEHLPEPVTTLRALADRLVPGGLLVLALPNAASLQARAAGDDWLAIDAPRHLVHVPAPALLAALRDLGLRVERTSHWRGGQVAFGWLDWLVRRATGASAYDAIRRPDARFAPLGRRRRAAALAAGALLAPAALALAAVEVALRRGGTIHVEARRPV